MLVTITTHSKMAAKLDAKKGNTSHFKEITQSPQRAYHLDSSAPRCEDSNNTQTVLRLTRVPQEGDLSVWTPAHSQGDGTWLCFSAHMKVRASYISCSWYILWLYQFQY